MNDLYFKFAHTSIGNSIYQALNLPQPVELDRSLNESISVPTGTFLMAATEKGFAVKNALSLLNTPNNCVHYLELEQNSYQALTKSIKDKQNIKTIGYPIEQKYDGLVFDATGIDSVEKLSTLYEFFHHSIKFLKKTKKIVILAQEPSQLKEPLTTSLQSALLGFSKSLAKEIGKKGSCCNVIFLQKGAEKYLDSSLVFFLSNKSSYITGQSVTLRSQTIKQLPESSLKPLSGKTALVTGAAQGIGRETAKTLARDGAKVVCLDIPQNQSSLDSLVDEINGITLAINLLDENAVNDVASNLISAVGKLDIVVHNAGITRDKTLAKMSSSLWDQVLTLNFERIVSLNQAFLEQNIFNEHARIICISSISGIAGNFGQTNYACSKAGIAAYVQSFADSTALKRNNGLTINAIAPGFIETQMTSSMPLLTREVGRRMNALSQGGIPLDIAEAISFFANPSSHCLNGNVLRVCGLSLLGR